MVQLPDEAIEVDARCPLRLLKLLDVPSQHHTNLAISPDEESLYVTAVDDDTKSAYRGQIVRMANPLAP